MKKTILFARLLSSIFRPTYYPTVGAVILLTMTYLSLLPWNFKLALLAVVYLFTIVLPSAGVYIYRRIHGWDAYELRKRHKRLVPYAIHLTCYFMLMELMIQMMMPRFITAIIAISLLIQCICILISLRWKISMHAAGSGGVIGALVTYSGIFGYNPVWWLCGAILLSGLVMTSRMILRQHTLPQVLTGTMVGVICGFIGIFFM